MTLPVLRLSAREFQDLFEYSATIPTGTTPGKRWKRLDGAHDPSFRKSGGVPKWVIGEYAPDCPADAKTIKINWYRPIICVRAAT